MKAEELMIGDWVHVNPISHRVEPHDDQVRSIRREYGNGQIYIEGGYKQSTSSKETNWFGWSVLPADLTPIPLTSDILEANGFKHITKGIDETDVWSLEIGKYVCLDISPIDDGAWLITDNGVAIKYVHELQHLFKLFGIVKNILMPDMLDIK